jgi:hypothetical protein
LVALGQLAQCLGYSLLLLADFEALFRGLLCLRERNLLLIAKRADSPLAAIGVHGEVARNAEQPAAEGAVGLQRVHTSDGSRHGLLANVFGVFSARRQANTEPVKGL